MGMLKIAPFFLITLVLRKACAIDWSNVPMPTKSVFLGLEPPSDSVKWSHARDLAGSGEQILLKKVLETVRNPMDFIQGKISFKDMHRLADVFISRASGGLTALKSQYSSKRAPVALFGYRTFGDGSSRHEGREKKFDGFHPEALREFTGKLPRKMVVIGMFLLLLIFFWYICPRYNFTHPRG